MMTGVADDNSAFLTMSGRGPISKNRAIAVLDGRIARGSYAVADQVAAYPGSMGALGVAFIRTKADDHAINQVNRCTHCSTDSWADSAACAPNG